MLIPNKFNGYSAGRRTYAFGFGGESGVDGPSPGDPGDFGGGSDTPSGGIQSLLTDNAPKSMLSDNYTPQDSTQRQFYQPVYQPSYTDYNLGNPLAVSQYGQDYVSPFSQGYGQDYGALFGQFFNPFSYSPQLSFQRPYTPPINSMSNQGIAGLSPFGNYGLGFEGYPMQDYGAAGFGE